MRSVGQRQDTPCPAVLSCPKCKELIADVCANPSSHRHNEYYYGHGTVREGLHTIYGNKCAYCEGNYIAGSPPRIDHFRPKNKIAEDPEYKGYFWLTYEWTNLIQACERCNRTKSNHFPLADEKTRVPGNSVRITTGLPHPDWLNPHQPLLAGEKRLLLHPEWDAVETHFFYTPDGRMHGKTEQGNKSIETYGLNRKVLVYARKKKSDEYLHRINRWLKHFVEQGENQAGKEALTTKITALFDDLISESDKDKEYSAYGFFMMEEFDTFYINRAVFYQDLLKEIYQRFNISESMEYPV
ncbi:MAG: hypothetical protein M3H12_08800 [Chromatiales bacterium]|nr:hypothetical protein [Gammaproteobacteria bacterium]